MTKTFGYLLCIFLFCVVGIGVTKSDQVYRPDIVKINNIKLYETAANIIIEHAKSRKIQVFQDDNGIFVNGDELLDEVTFLYQQALASEGMRNIECVEGDLVVVYVNKMARVVINFVVKDP